MQRNFQLAMSGALLVWLCLVSGISPAFASTRQVSTHHTPSAHALPARIASWHPHGWLTHNQYFHGNSYSGLHLTFHGHNQLNTGNQGLNRGYNQNYGANGGNLIVNRGRSRYQRTNQWYSGNSYSQSRLSLTGYNQENTGNQGDNEGSNEDHGGNAGNQIVN